MKSRARESEEAVAIAAITVAPRHISGDAGWAAVKTAVHGGRVLSSMGELTPEQLKTLWAPLEAAVALRSLTDAPVAGRPSRVLAKRTPAPAEEVKVEKKRAARPRAEALYGPNTAEVSAFVKAIPELSPIQWLRVLDRRQLVASVTLEGEDESAVVVRSILAAARASAELELGARCSVFSAVERAAFALAARVCLGGGSDQAERDRAGRAAVPDGGGKAERAPVRGARRALVARGRHLERARPSDPERLNARCRRGGRAGCPGHSADARQR